MEASTFHWPKDCTFFGIRDRCSVSFELSGLYIMVLIKSSTLVISCLRVSYLGKSYGPTLFSQIGLGLLAACMPTYGPLLRSMPKHGIFGKFKTLFTRSSRTSRTQTRLTDRNPIGNESTISHGHILAPDKQAQSEAEAFELDASGNRFQWHHCTDGQNNSEQKVDIYDTLVWSTCLRQIGPLKSNSLLSTLHSWVFSQGRFHAPSLDWHYDMRFLGSACLDRTIQEKTSVSAVYLAVLDSQEE